MQRNLEVTPLSISLRRPGIEVHDPLLVPALADTGEIPVDCRIMALLSQQIDDRKRVTGPQLVLGVRRDVFRDPLEQRRPVTRCGHETNAVARMDDGSVPRACPGPGDRRCDDNWYGG